MPFSRIEPAQRIPLRVISSEIPRHPNPHKGVPRPIGGHHTTEIIHARITVISLHEKPETGPCRRLHQPFLRRNAVDPRIEEAQFGALRSGGDGCVRRFGTPQRSVAQFPADEQFQHPSVTVARSLHLRELLARRKQLGLHRIGVGLRRRTVAQQRTDLVEITPQQSDRDPRLRDPFVEQQDAEIEAVHTPFERIEVRIGGTCGLGGFGFGHPLVGRRPAAVPDRLAQFQLRLVLVPVQPGNLQSLSGEKSRHLARKSGNIGLPGRLRRQGKLRQPGPAGIRQIVFGSTPDQVVLPNFGIMPAGQLPALVERRLRLCSEYARQQNGEKQRPSHTSLRFRGISRRMTTSIVSCLRSLKNVSRSAARSPSSGTITG